MSLQRTEVQKSDQWDLDTLYPSFEVWKKAFQEAAPAISPRFPPLSPFKGALNQGPEVLRNALETLLELDRRLSKLYTFAHLKHDEEITENQAKTSYIEALGALHDFNQEASWFEPELLSLPNETIAEYLRSPVLKDYRFYLEKLFRMKPHTLSEDKELLLAMSGKALSATAKAFSAINDADFKFEPALDSEKKPHPLTHASYSLLLRSKDRILRENTFKTYYEKYQGFENTLAELLNGQVEAHVFNAKARGFKSSLEASLFPNNIDPSVYHALIEAVHEEIGALHQYAELRAKILKLDPLRMYDLQVPLVADFEMTTPYKDAEGLIIDSAAPLGDEYQNALKKGLQNDRWVDRFENKNKRSGAYSSGCYDSNPYILMNYKNILRDVFTLSHEAGHSMHSYFSRKDQPYCYSNYSIFIAEVASTFNEELLMQAMLKNARSREEKIFLLTQKIEDIRATLFRQTQFAEFELLIHTYAEKNVPLTPELLNQEYLKLNTFYYGSAIQQEPLNGSEWSRIPHFYYNFYVYQYATGISAALALADRVLQGGQKECTDYLNFLKTGGSVYPLEALKIAGVDMQSVQPVKKAIEKFRILLRELETLLMPEKNLAVK
jgi:oligoendopeptidase F